MKEKYFNTDDFLDRYQYAEFLKNIIANSDKFSESEGSYVIALDSIWGSGKSYFISMFKNYLNGYLEKNNTYPGYVKNIKYITFNAWENDFWENAFEPLMTAILENDYFRIEKDVENAKKIVKDLGNTAIKVTKAFVKKQISNQIGDDITDILDDELSQPLGTFILNKTKLFKDYRDFKDSIVEFKKILASYINTLDNGQKLLIIIDELDRCKPTFAIQLLEIVKHLFDIKGLVFLFTVDIEQLSHSIKTVYGEGMDTTSYLCRFFDYISRMPSPSVKNYIKGYVEIIDEMYGLFDGVESHKMDIVEDYFCDLYDSFHLSLRELNTILNTYKIMIETFLKDYKEIEAHFLYLFFLAFKYKNVSDFNDVFIRKDNINLNYAIAAKYPDIRTAINSLPLFICDLKLPLYINNKDINSLNEHLSLKIKHVSDGIIYMESDNKNISDRTYTSDVVNSRISNLLFEPDIIIWNDIYNITYAEYIHKQLEMFNYRDGVIES